MNKKLWIALSIFLIVGLGGGFGFWSYTQTPKYSLYKAQTAYKNHDLTMFKKYIDTKGLSERFVNYVFDDSMAELESDSWASLGQGLVTMMKPRLSEMLLQQIHQAVESGDFESSALKSEGELNISLSNIIKDPAGGSPKDLSIGETRKDGKIAEVDISMFYPLYDQNLVLTIKMRKLKNYWQVADIANYNEFMQNLQELEKARLEKLNQAVHQKLLSTLKVISVVRKNGTDEWKIYKQVNLKAGMQNISKKTISNAILKMTFNKADGTTIESYNLEYSKPILAGKTASGYWQLEMSSFSSDKELAIYNTPDSELKIVTEPSYIQFEDGSEIKLFQSGEIPSE